MVRRGARGASAWRGCPRSDVPVYFLEHHRYFDRPHLYGPPADRRTPDNLERFTFLSRGALELTKALGFIPDVIHANDWQTALVPVYVEHRRVGAAAARERQRLHASTTSPTRACFDGGALFITGLGPEHYHAARVRALRRRST